MNKLTLYTEPAAVGSLPVEPSFPLIGKVAYRKISTLTDSGTTHEKSVATDPDESYQFIWNTLSEAEYDLLRAFFLSNKGPLDSFIWQTERWMFADPDIEFTQISVSPDSGMVFSARVTVEKIPEICPVNHPTSS